ncbi:MAG: helix-turn-helix domain-containing protein [Propionibacteriaceae bacterium]|jgi:DNA-binding XRE family transcriptional regulator|nr:helix-turn-helix domain-containing protein [Propionibacteriaceae bacterium]
MKTQEVLAELRKNLGLTQDEMAAKLYVTRQAVSRWETGATTPDVKTLQLISQEFGVSVDTLLGRDAVCQSCAMPLTKIEEVGTESDGGFTKDYCQYCYKDGHFAHDHTMEEMIESNLQYLDQWNSSQGTSFSTEEAREILKVHLATLERWKARADQP